MKIKCEYCGGMFEDTLEKCPHCGAVNANIKRMADKTPQTMDDLYAWYAAHNLPPYETTRFFLGIDYKKPKAFGIYKDGENFIVYKNKADGSRAVRYKGTDEAYAVNEIYLKLKSEILNQKENNMAKKSAGARSTASPQKKGFNPGCSLMTIGYLLKGFFGMLALGIMVSDLKSLIPVIVVALIFFVIFLKNQDLYEKIKRLLWPALIIAMIVSLAIFGENTTPRYYNYDNDVIVRYDNDYYMYDYYEDDYMPLEDDYLPADFAVNPDYYETENWDRSITDFEDSDYYSDNFGGYDAGSSSYYSYSSSDSDWSSWDSGSSWDSSDSWDSGSSDWDSDW
ncbi:MAG: hypothetical protein J6Z09_03985 [Lachnospiraceae bacterium]|nr:hypothetical protein [Lachnospiraceae bacterium]